MYQQRYYSRSCSLKIATANWAWMLLVLMARSASGQYMQYDRVMAADAANGDRFGYVVGVVNTTVVVGAPGANNMKGAVYVFKQNDTTKLLKQMYKLTAADGAAGDQFGNTLVFSGDMLVVGAPYRDQTVIDQGAVYIFQHNADGSFTQKDKVVGDGTAGSSGGDQFGRSIALSEDRSRLIVGATGDAATGSNSGAAYFFTLSTAFVATRQQKVKADVVTVADQFGRAVAINDDGALVGAFQNQPFLAPNQGSVYHHRLSSGTWSQYAKITASDGALDDRFGVNLQLKGPRLLVGAHFDDSPLQDAGSLYLFVRAFGDYNEQFKFTANDPGVGDFFGYSFNLNGDTLIVGSPLHNTDGVVDSGAAYIYMDSFGTNEFELYQKIIAKPPVISEQFGYSVAVDSESELFVIGAVPVTQTAAPGAVYLFSVDVGTQVPSSPPSLEPSSAPSPAPILCAKIYECKPRLYTWPFNKHKYVYIQSFNGPEDLTGTVTTCNTKCVTEEQFVKRWKDKGWDCGTCVY